MIEGASNGSSHAITLIALVFRQILAPVNEPSIKNMEKFVRMMNVSN